MKKQFSAKAIIQGSTGVYLGDIGLFYELYSFILGRRIYTHELGKGTISNSVKGYITKKYPQFSNNNKQFIDSLTSYKKAVQKVSTTEERISCTDEFIKLIENKYGDTFWVGRLNKKSCRNFSFSLE